MKTYLTESEFSELFFYKLEKNKVYINSSTPGDKIIWIMFSEFEEEIKKTLECSMYDIDKFEGNCPSELIGCQFHKSFRQIDVIPSRYIDSIIYISMQDSPVFWDTMYDCCKILASESDSKFYKKGNKNERSN